MLGVLFVELLRKVLAAVQVVADVHFNLRASHEAVLRTISNFALRQRSLIDSRCSLILWLSNQLLLRLTEQ